MLFTIRIGDLDDLDGIYQLNCDSFVESWSYDGLKNAVTGGCELLIAESDGEFAGYLLTQNILDEIHIMQIAVISLFQRQGIAAQLTQQLIQEKHGWKEMFLEVRASNKPARKLYAQLGFSETGCRKNYYTPNESGIREDAVLMTFHQKLTPT
ncbi:MAG: ribosomal protein S18-alanine N-acetyltransferase [Mariprofundaceae bacterium]